MEALWATGVVMLVVVLWVALKIAREVQKAIDRKEGGNSRAEHTVSWLSGIHGLLGALVGAATGLKYIYREWKTAPLGSPEKLGWGCLLALIVAMAMFVVVRLVDKKLNASHEVASPESLSGERRSG